VVPRARIARAASADARRGLDARRHRNHRARGERQPLATRDIATDDGRSRRARRLERSENAHDE